MRKIFALLVICVLALSAVIAAKGGNQGTELQDAGPDDGEDTAGKDNNTTKVPKSTGNVSRNETDKADRTQDPGKRNITRNQTGSAEDDVNKTKDPVQAREEARLRVQQIKAQLENQTKSSRGPSGESVKNQNQVRLAVHALLEMKDVLGGIGKNVSEIARDFNNSAQATARAEERIESKGGFARFFSGGDEEAADELEEEVAENEERIEKLKQLKEECTDCEAEATDLLDEQIDAMEQEQERLKDLAAKEKKSKGIFGWMWK